MRKTFQSFQNLFFDLVFFLVILMLLLITVTISTSAPSVILP